MHTDHLGTPQAMTDSNRTVVWKGDYKPFGEVNEVVGAVGNNFRFPGQYYDAESGLYYNWNRYYWAGVGRYLTADPIGLDGGLNLYGYVGGDPVNWVDFNGMYVDPYIVPRNLCFSALVIGAIIKSEHELCNKLDNGECGFLAFPFCSTYNAGVGIGLFIKVCMDCDGQCNASYYFGIINSGDVS